MWPPCKMGLCQYECVCEAGDGTSPPGYFWCPLGNDKKETRSVIQSKIKLCNNGAMEIMVLEGLADLFCPVLFCFVLLGSKKVKSDNLKGMKFIMACFHVDV